MRVTKEFIEDKARKLALPANNRGQLNPDSTATSEHWDWSDFSRAIEWLCLYYAAVMPLFLPEDNPLDGGKRPSKGEMAIFMAERECELNEHFIRYGSRSEIFETLTRNGQFYLDKVIRTLVGYAAMEVDAGYPSQPRIAYGLADVAYPQILPIVRQRIVDDAREEQKL